MKTWGWYEAKSYAHFDLPLSDVVARAYVEDPERIARHSFRPFLAFSLTSRKFKRRGNRYAVLAKNRPIRMASHVDGYIFAYYASKLSGAYETAIAGTSVAESAVAYRRGLGSNIDFAKAAFEEIERRGDCVAIALDIHSFFDNIDHAQVKLQWERLLKVDRLPPDHYAVFKAITAYAMVDREACYKRLGISDPNNIPRPICDAKTFRERIRGKGGAVTNLVERNNLDQGVPQGSQISAFLSNLYMLPFDQRMCKLAFEIGGYYRRYSDDLLWICSPNDETRVMRAIEDGLSDVGKNLSVNHDKDMICRFVKQADGTIRSSPSAFQYLGFTFDGQRKLLRSGTLSRYWRRMVYAVRAVRRRAAKAGASGGHSEPFKRSLYRMHTHLGRRRNFVRYAYRAADEMGARSIRRQVGKHWERIQDELKKPPT